MQLLFKVALCTAGVVVMKAVVEPRFPQPASIPVVGPYVYTAAGIAAGLYGAKYLG